MTSRGKGADVAWSRFQYQRYKILKHVSEWEELDIRYNKLDIDEDNCVKNLAARSRARCGCRDQILLCESQKEDLYTEQWVYRKVEKNFYIFADNGGLCKFFERNGRNDFPARDATRRTPAAKPRSQARRAKRCGSCKILFFIDNLSLRYKSALMRRPLLPNIVNPNWEKKTKKGESNYKTQSTHYGILGYQERCEGGFPQALGGRPISRQVLTGLPIIYRENHSIGPPPNIWENSSSHLSWVAWYSVMSFIIIFSLFRLFLLTQA